MSEWYDGLVLKDIPWHMRFILLFVKGNWVTDYGSNDGDYSMKSKQFRGVTYIVDERWKPK